MKKPDPLARSSDPGITAACDELSNACFCTTLDERQLREAIEQELGDTELAGQVTAAWSAAFAQWPVFVSFANWRRMERVVQAIEQVAALPGWREEALRSAPPIASHTPKGARGVFFGYDFHVEGGNVGLIEINTNAGGALVNTLLARAQRKCCASVRQLQPDTAAAEGFESAIVEMFRTEWRLARGDEPLRCIAIIDESPPSQYLYPEFLLFERLFSRHGIRAIIADPAQVSFDAGVLRCGGEAIDLVYNRLTDFYLEAPDCAALRSAYLQDAVVLTPHPQAHALYADKRRLVILSDQETLLRLGAPDHVRAILRDAVPATTIVTAQNADELWSRRRELFFKPFSGFGSRAAYRGDKLTKRVWLEIAAGGYVAQQLVPPGTRATSASDPHAHLKFDLRLFAYAGRAQWTAARLYQGQTTNFRTSGGGFAPVYTLPAEHGAIQCGSEPRDEHASFVFLLDQMGHTHPLPHGLYVALARGEAASPALAGQRFRAADWYVRMENGTPREVINEWYGWVEFDKSGRFDPTGDRPKQAPEIAPIDNVDPSAFPDVDERALMSTALFGPR
jgi:hypothetical protein